MGRSLHALSPQTRWLAVQREVLDRTDSTNLRAEARAAAGAPDGAIVVADHQTAGRGRLGRSFFSPEGVGLYLSVLLRPTGLAPEDAHRHVFAAAVAVAECAVRVPGLEDAVEIKWPNDVLLRGRKTSGINLAVRLAGDGAVDWLILGVGVNVNTPREAFPPELRELATSLAASAGHAVDRTDFAEKLLARLEDEIDALRSGGFAGVLDRWRKFFRMRGERVVVRLGTPVQGDPRPPDPVLDPDAGAIEGVVDGIDEQGALLLKTRRGVERIVAGDVTRALRED